MQPLTKFLNDTSNKKNALFEIDIPTAFTFWINDSPGVYKYKYRNSRQNTKLGFEIGSFCYGNFKFNGIADTGVNSAAAMIGSMSVNGRPYPRANTLSECKRNVYTFYYDSSETIIYVNFFDVLPWHIRSLKIGVTKGYAIQATYLGDIYYEARIKSIPNVSIQVDDLYFGIRRYSFGSVTLFNEDGEFDDFEDSTVYGQECRVKLGGITIDGTELGYSDYITLYTGYIQKFNTNPRELTITVGDLKDKIGRTIPANFFSSSDYADIKSANDGKPIPLIWGTCKNCPCICVNEDESPTPANYQFVIADITKHSIKNLSAVYIDGVAQSAPTLVNDTTNNIAYFNIASGGNYTAGQTVTADIVGFDNSDNRDGTGTAIDNALDIVKDIFADYLMIPYTSYTFDQDKWELETNAAYDHGIWVGQNTRVSEIMEKIAIGHLGVFFIDGLGRWAFSTIRDYRQPMMLIELDEIINEPTKLNDGTKYLTSATVLHSIDNQENKYASYTDTSSEVETVDTYGIYRTNEFKTYLSANADAVILSADIMTEFKVVRPGYSVLTTIRASDLQLYDTIVAVINRRNSTWMGPLKLRVMGINYKLQNPMVINLSLRYIEDSTVDRIYDILNITKNSEYILNIVKDDEKIINIKRVS